MWGAVRKHPRKTLAMQQLSSAPLNSFTQVAAEPLSPDPSTSKTMVVDQSWPQKPTMHTNAHDSPFAHDHASLHSLPVLPVTSLQTSTLDQRPTAVKESEQRHQANVASPTSPLHTRVSQQPVSLHSSTVRSDDYLHQAEIASPVQILSSDESSSPPTAASSAYELSEDTPRSTSASPDTRIDSGGNQYQTLVLDAIESALGLTPSHAWLCGTEQQSAEDSDFHVCAAAAQVGQQCVDSDNFVLASTLWQRNIWTETETENNLTVHYFDNTCPMVSCFDSRQSPFRKDIPRIMLTCEYLNDCIKALSAAHLANSIRGMDNVALRYQTKAIRGLMSVLQTLQFPSHHKSSDNGLSRVSATFARYQALMAALLLANSAAWVDASAIGLTHHRGARLLFQAWLLDEGIHDTPKDPVVLDREQSFIIGAIVHQECLLSIVIDQPVESLQYLLHFATLAQEQRVHPHPFTGISTPLFIYLAESFALVRQKRNLMSQGERGSDYDVQISRRARELYMLVLAHRPPLVTSVDDTQDPNTPLSHLFAVDAMLRLVILLELIQSFPKVTLDDAPTRQVRQTRLDLAIAILTIVSDLPEPSGANIIISIPLLSAGSALQSTESTPRNIHQGYDLSSNSLDALRSQIAALMHRPATLQMWRDQVSWRVERLRSRVNVAPVKRISAILEAVWHQADKAANSGTCTSRNMVHWMDVMIEGRLETLFG
ncbi:hypothetical protein COCSADRAFT_178369 [Bipolaris sorokiniana ND90Pr]|nr:uncharacterized protein COCSADRAFT_178369 [Bipolaris sorokiniana ND90Pr]EMD68571.1 hypothetical protein COCSADRAFT_178369 [Bipolaris sorokiniana ND90Pr]